MNAPSERPLLDYRHKPGREVAATLRHIRSKAIDYLDYPKRKGYELSDQVWPVPARGDRPF